MRSSGTTEIAHSDPGLGPALPVLRAASPADNQFEYLQAQSNQTLWSQSNNPIHGRILPYLTPNTNWPRKKLQR